MSLIWFLAEPGRTFEPSCLRFSALSASSALSGFDFACFSAPRRLGGEFAFLRVFLSALCVSAVASCPLFGFLQNLVELSSPVVCTSRRSLLPPRSQVLTLLVSRRLGVSAVNSPFSASSSAPSASPRLPHVPYLVSCRTW